MKTNKYSQEGYYHVPIKVDRYLIISSVKKYLIITGDIEP
jgi:hypothetical protein